MFPIKPPDDVSLEAVLLHVPRKELHKRRFGRHDHCGLRRDLVHQEAEEMRARAAGA